VILVDECTPGFAETATTLGGIDCTATSPVMSVRDPLALANWTMPIVETLMIVGAIASLIHAVLWWRRRGDPSNLALWAASVVYVVILEPPLYFPDRFGLAGSLDLIFVHNLFTVQFLQDRLPLYILALYPALTYLAYVLVQRTGIFERRNPLVGAACVAFVFHCFYEIFDNLGPQVQWWAWNPGAPSNAPWLGSVPLTSAAIFAAASPFGFALLSRLLVARRAAKGPVPPWSMALRVVGVGILTPLAMMLFSIPYYAFSLGDSPNLTAQTIALWLVIGLFAVVALSAFWQALRDQRDTPPTEAFLDHYGAIAAAVYLLVFAVLWATALPGYFSASGGLTPSGTPIGSLTYVIACTVACLGVLTLVVVVRRCPALIAEPKGV
jgi:hypothetical protein